MHRFLLPLGVLLALTAASPAFGASTVAVDGATLTISAPDDERNRITVSGLATGEFTVVDVRWPITPGAGCTATRENRVTCGSSATTDLVADLGPDNDSIAIEASARLRARLQGGIGNDVLGGGPLADLIDGGPGRDAVTYADRTTPVTVTLAGSVDDGAPGEGDEVVGMEQAIGGGGGDTLFGTEVTDTLTGGPGDDRLDGLGGDDALAGGPGADQLTGGDGDDRFLADAAPDGPDVLAGGPGGDVADYSLRTGGLVVDTDGVADDGDVPGAPLKFIDPLPALAALPSPERDNVLPETENVTGGGGTDVLGVGFGGGTADGGGGTDVLFGGPDLDDLYGGAGFDRIVARDGATDEIECGADIDRVWTDFADHLAADCERRVRTVPAALGPIRRRVTAGRLGVSVACPIAAYVRCRGTLRATTRARSPRRRRTLGSGTFTVRSGATGRAVIRFGRSSRPILRSAGGARVRLVTRGRDDAGRLRPFVARLRLRGR